MKTKNYYQQQMNPSKIIVLTCLTAVLGLVACEQKGTAEKAGEKIDRTAIQAEKNIEESTDKANKEMEDAQETMDEEAEKAQQQIDQSAEQADEKLNENRDAISNKAETAEKYIDDSLITAKVKAAILNDALLKASQIEVSTDNGVVKLSGTVDSEQSIGRAMEIASGQKDVKSVQADLSVNANASSKK